MAMVHQPFVILTGEWKQELDSLERKICLKDIYNHSRAIEHDLENKPLIGWLSTSVTSLSSLFFHELNTIDNYMESDKMYWLWFFLNTIFDNSSINAIGKEKSSVSNAMIRNFKRKVSAVEEMPDRRIGRKTKKTKHGGFKLPHVMKDMLLTGIQKNPSMIYKAHVVGYNINGSTFQLMDMVCPQGYVTRIRRLNQLEFPSDKYDFVKGFVF
ncbi:hypothetical protein BDB01DRAFT_833965 [Pilobolus umbonatus]|nr:hypothetical protein BDB01DRAFT_833965 [Pilobolus umbonatus]